VDANDCSQATPCTPTKAISISDPQHPWVRLLPGTYAALAANTSFVNQTLTLVGTGATWPYGGGYFDVSAGSNVTVRGIAGPLYRCYPTSGAAALTLSDISSPGDMTGNNVMFLSNCTVRIERSLLGPFRADGGLDLVIDRSSIIGNVVGVIPSGTGERLTITNSVFTNAALAVSFNQPVNSAAVSEYLAYNTFYRNDGNGALACPLYVAASSVVYMDNIFYAPGASSGYALYKDPTSGGCTPDTNIEYPQAASVGANAVLLDPKLVDAPNGNFHLMIGSPAIDAAKVTTSDPTVDYDGTTRPQGPRLDIGAFEYK
jgi:hypothetical protein